jgi:DNA replication factor GINS
MDLDELHAVLISERETGRLIQIPPDLFDRTIRHLELLRRELEVSATADPESNETRILIERVGSVRETLSDIFRARSEKILSLAYIQNEGRHTEKEELKRMLLPEREMYRGICEAIGRCRTALLGEAETCPPGRAGMVAETVPAVPGPRSHGIRPGFVLVRAREDVEPFMGVDGKIYHLMKEDVAVIPARNAEVLNERNIVLSINLSS